MRRQAGKGQVLVSVCLKKAQREGRGCYNNDNTTLPASLPLFYDNKGKGLRITIVIYTDSEANMKKQNNH